MAEQTLSGVTTSSGAWRRVLSLHWLPWIAVAGAMACLGWRMFDGLTLPPFSDEMEHIVGGMVLDVGGRLYEDFVDIHGPLIFMYTHLYGALFGWKHANDARLISVILALLNGVMIVLSPGVRGPARLLGLATFLGLLATIWLRQDLYALNFYPLAGSLAGIALAAFVVPAWRGAGIRPAAAVIAGLALSLLAAAAYSFMPSVLLFVLSGACVIWPRADRSSLLYCLLGLTAGTVAVLIYLIIFGDVLGYLAYHIAENQFTYARFIYFSMQTFLNSLIPNGAPNRLVQSFLVISAFGGLVVFVALDVWERRFRPRQVAALLMGWVGILLLNARGSPAFHDGVFAITTVAVASLAIAHLLSKFDDRVVYPATLGVVALIALTEWCLRPALYEPFQMSGAAVVALGRWHEFVRSESPGFRRIREVAHPDERILILVYRPGDYILAGRLPIKGHFTYLPWMQPTVSSRGLGASETYAPLSRRHHHR